MAKKNGKQLLEDAMRAIPSISCKTFADLQRGGADYTLIDVRERDEWDAGHMPEAVHIPRGMLELQVEEIVPNRHAPIILCCAHGGRAALAVRTLLDMGYTDLKYLEGGYQGYCERT